MGKRVLITLFGFVVAIAGYGVWRTSRLPLQPSYQAMARIVSITPEVSRWRTDIDWIVVRNDRGTGQFWMRSTDMNCDVGDEVPVLQEGVSLKRLPDTCKHIQTTKTDR